MKKKAKSKAKAKPKKTAKRKASKRTKLVTIHPSSTVEKKLSKDLRDEYRLAKRTV